MSLLALTNKCFNNCVVKHKPVLINDEVRKQMLTNKLNSVCQNILEVDPETWLLSEKETVCVYNCSKSYVDLKAMLHDQMLRDYTHVRKNNRNLFESL